MLNSDGVTDKLRAMGKERGAIAKREAYAGKTNNVQLPCHALSRVGSESGVDAVIEAGRVNNRVGEF